MEKNFVEMSEVFKTLTVINEKINEIYDLKEVNLSDEKFYDLFNLKRERNYLEQFLSKVYVHNGEKALLYNANLINKILNSHLKNENYRGEKPEDFEKYFEDLFENEMKLLFRRIETLMEYKKENDVNANLVLTNLVRSLHEVVTSFDSSSSFVEKKLYDCFKKELEEQVVKE